ncbi:hypothetical protein ACFOVU_09670 [Nocardiopsis sediminis]|uniref:Peptidase M48 domain-containing protein n=1 Tax=Nocardiopsis sediminis TaxID=1778267 RepID=A0ABV8FK30_9ACTN
MATPTDTPTESGVSYPDPFRLPSATATRFLLLIVATVGASLAVMTVVVAFFGSWALPGIRACTDIARAEAGETLARTLLYEFRSCSDRALRITNLVTFLACTAPILIGIAIYAAYPRLLLRRLTPLRSLDGVIQHRAVEELQAALGASRARVRLLITPGTAGGARAFGAWGRYWIAVDRSLLAVGAQPGGELSGHTDAVIHHEAAHVRNRDIDITYLTIGMWWGFVAVAALLLPLLLLRPAALVFGLPLAAALAVLTYARARVLQVREFYADARAARDPRIRRCLLTLFDRPVRRTQALERAWRSLTSPHPRPATRRAVVEDPSLLLRGDYLDVAYAGCAVGLSYSAFLLMARSLTGMQIPGLVFGALLSVILTTVVWRSTTRTRALGLRPLPVGRMSLALTGGILLGQFMMPQLHVITWGSMLITAPGSALLMAALLWGACAIAMGSISFAASCWIGGSRRVWPLWACAAVNAPVIATVLVVWFFTLAAHAVYPGWWSVISSTFTALGINWHLPMAALGLGIAFPLTSWLAWRPKRPVGGGLVADPPSTTLCPPWGPVIAALVTAACFIVAVDVDSRVRNESGMEELLLGMFAAILTTVALAWLLGGRGASGRVVCATAVTVYLIAPLGIPALYIGNRIGTCFDTPVGLMSCWTDVVPEAERWVSAVDTSVFHLVPLLLVCCPIAVMVSKARGLLGRPPRPLGPAVRRWPGVSASLAILLLGLGTPILVLYSRSTLEAGTEPRPLDAAARAELLRPLEEQRSEGRATCQAIDEAGQDSLEVGPVRPGGGLDLSDARSVRAMAASADPVLRAFGEAAIAEAAGPRSREVTSDAAQAGEHYCATTHPGTGILLLAW